MSKISTSLLTLVFAMALTATLSAQDGADIQQRILKANKDISSIQSTYTHLRTNAFGRVSKRQGDFYYIDSTSQLALIGTDPKNKDFITSDGFLHHSMAPVTMNVNLKRSTIMRALTNTMLWAIRGELQNIINDNTVDVTYTTEGGYYVITMEARSGFNRGISSIVLKYDVTHCLLRHLEIEEVIHVSHTFQIGNHVTLDQPINQKVFNWKD